MHLVLGTPGPVARRLVEELSCRGEELLVLAPQPEENLVSRGVELIVGDGTGIDFGLSGKAYQDLLRRVSHVYSVTEPQNETGRAEDSRVVRTALELSEFVRAGGAPRGLTVLSSLLVFGDLNGLVSEDEFFKGQSFAGHYEKSLALAEKIIRELRDERPLSILRTGPVVGDERGAKVIEGSPLDQLERYLEAVLSHEEMGHAFSELATRWETVDRAVAALLAISPPKGVSVLHLVDREPLSDRALLEWLAERKGKRLRESTGGARLWAKWVRPAFRGSRALRGWSLEFSRVEAEKLLGKLLDRDERATLASIFPQLESSRGIKS